MQRTLTFTITFLISFYAFSQKNNSKLVECLLINKLCDTISFLGKNLNSLSVHNGFRVFDESGSKTDTKVLPDNYEYLILKDLELGDLKFKSLKKSKGALYTRKSVNAFMQIGIENSQSDFDNGKYNVYAHKYITNINSGYGMDTYTNFFIYVEDKNGFYLVQKKKDIIKYLGKEGYNIYKNSKNKHKLLFFSNNIN